MIKKMQRMKSKKGFTLVELLVVIAIIGILAAILIPLMSTFISNSRVQSANSTATSMKSTVSGWLQAQSGYRGQGMVGSGATATQSIIIGTGTATGWTFTNSVNTAFASGSHAMVTAATPPSGYRGQTLQQVMDDAFPGPNTGTTCLFVVQGGGVVIAMYSAEHTLVAGDVTIASPSSIRSTIVNGRDTAGNGRIIGSNPAT